MKYLIKNCKVVHRGSKYHDKIVDILVDKGKISEIRAKISDPKAKVIKGSQLHASIGWMDIGTYLGEPGYEHRETFDSLSKAAKAGGYTDLVTMPKSIPAIQSKAQVTNLITTASALGIDIHPLGALSQDLDGNALSEIVDMHHAGAVGFTDGLQPVEKSGLLLRALQYVKQFGGIIVHHPNDLTLANEDMIHEGSVSTSLGMKGSPALAEVLMTYRDVQLLQYADSRLCIHLISSKESLEIIKKAKKSGLHLTSGVSYINLVKSHEDLGTFDSQLKVKPVIREMSDQKALRKGLGDDTLDYISSNHCPLEVEKKHLEFPYASHGAIGLETCFAALNSMTSKDLSLETIVHKLAVGPRVAMGMDIPEFAKGMEAKITVFDPTIEWTYQADDIQSTSQNSPYIGQEFKGKVVATINKTSVSSHN